MDEHSRDRQGVGDVARVLAARAAEAIERIARDVVAARNRNRLDRLGHLGDGNGEKSIGHRLRLPPVADIARERRKAFAHDFVVERVVAASAEYFWEQIGDQLACHQVGVGDCERAAAAIGRGSGIGLRLKRGQRESARHRMRGSSRLPQRRYGFSSSARACARLRLRSRTRARIRRQTGDVGRGAAHVEADDALEPCADPGAPHRHHAPGRA